MVCTIDGTNIIAGTDTQLNNTYYSGNYISAVKSSKYNIFIAHGKGSVSYGLLASFLPNILPVTSTSQTISGVAKKKGTSNQTIPVYVPNI